MEHVQGTGKPSALPYWGVVVWKTRNWKDFDCTRCGHCLPIRSIHSDLKLSILSAIAKECGSTFISVKASSLMEKWFGETDKLVAALFSLSRKLAPCVLFIDEIDTLLKSRGGQSSSSSALDSMQVRFYFSSIP